jgi:hypothetical protein
MPPMVLIIHEPVQAVSLCLSMSKFLSKSLFIHKLAGVGIYVSFDLPVLTNYHCVRSSCDLNIDKSTLSASARVWEARTGIPTAGFKSDISLHECHRIQIRYFTSRQKEPPAPMRKARNHSSHRSRTAHRNCISLLIWNRVPSQLCIECTERRI